LIRKRGGEIIRAVGDEIVGPHQSGGILSTEPLGMSLDAHVRIDGHGRILGRVGLQPADIGGSVRDLALQIGQADAVEIHYPERADAGSGKVQDQRTAKPACPHDEDARLQQARLSGPADFAQHDMAGVAFQLLVAQGFGTGGRRRDRNSWPVSSTMDVSTVIFQVSSGL